MPLPALYCRFAQATVKTAMASDGTCSGAQRAPCRPRVWWHDRRPHTPCRGRRPRRPMTHRRNQQAADKTRMPPNCHCEEAKGRRGNLGKALTISPIAFPQFSRALRDCTPRALPRASRSGRHVASLLAMTSLRVSRHKIHAPDIADLHGAQGAPLQAQLVGTFYRCSVRTASACPRLPRRFAPRNDKRCLPF